jgi:hypothetical protein
MIIAWLICAVPATFVSRFCKAVLPGLIWLYVVSSVLHAVPRVLYLYSSLE